MKKRPTPRSADHHPRPMGEGKGEGHSPADLRPPISQKPPRRNQVSRARPARTSPLAVPFKADQFCFPRQQELMGELLNMPIYRSFAAGIDLESLNARQRTQVAECYPLPPGACPRLDEAVTHLRTVLRTSCPFRVVLDEDRFESNCCRAVRDGQSFAFIFPARHLARPTTRQLVFHLAVAYFHAHQPLAHIHRQLLIRQHPLHLSERERIVEFLRLNGYLSDCFAVLCTGDPALTASESYFRTMNHEAAAVGINLHQFAQAHLQTGEMSGARCLENWEWVTGYRPGTPLMVERFQQSELHHTLTGQPGGRPLPEFEAEVLGLDRRLHPPGGDFTPLHSDTFHVGMVAALYRTMEAMGAVTPDRERTAARMLDSQPEILHQHMRTLDLDLAQPHIGEIMLETLGRPHLRRWLNLRAAEIIMRSWSLAKSEGCARYDGPLRDALDAIGNACALNPQEVEQLINALEEADTVSDCNGPIDEGKD